jgi:hypothetical protein
MTDQQNSPQHTENALHRVASRDRHAAGKITEELAELDSELRDLVEQRHEIGADALAVGVACWGTAVERVFLGRLVPRAEIDEFLQDRMRALAFELGITPRLLKARRI